MQSILRRAKCPGLGGSWIGPGTGLRFVTSVMSAWLACAGTAEAGSKGLLKIGGNKQLFIDDYIIESLSHAKQILNPGRQTSGKPPFDSPDRPWEGHYIGLQRVIYDPDQGLYRMWYRATGAFESQKGGADRLRPYRWDWSVTDGKAVRSKVEEVYGYKQYAGGQDWVLCYATSRDGIHWEKPNLGQVAFEGSRGNNLLPSGTLVPLFRDENESDPAKRYKAMRSEGTTPTAWKTGNQAGNAAKPLLLARRVRVDPLREESRDRHCAQDRPLGTHVTHGLGTLSGRSTPCSWSSACTGAVPGDSGSSAGPRAWT